MSAILSSMPPAAFVPPAEDRVEAKFAAEEAYQRLLSRLCKASVNKRYEAYRDIDWDAHEMRIDPDDPVFALPEEDSLGGTAWYRAQPAGARSRIGLQMSASFMYTGRLFEGILCRGLLRFAMAQPHRSLECRFAYHEVIEEAHHSLMFQEFVNRSGMPVPLVDAELLETGDFIAELGSSFPELLFFYALGGEDPIDFAQRDAIQRGVQQHPLLRRISQIHITEEARHTAFARAYLRVNVPRLAPERRQELSILVPQMLGQMAAKMLEAPPAIVEGYDIPPDVVAEAYTDNVAHRQRTIDALAKIRELCQDLDLMAEQPRSLWLSEGLMLSDG